MYFVFWHQGDNFWILYPLINMNMNLAIKKMNFEKQIRILKLQIVYLFLLNDVVPIPRILKNRLENVMNKGLEINCKT